MKIPTLSSLALAAVAAMVTAGTSASASTAQPTIADIADGVSDASSVAQSSNLNILRNYHDDGTNDEQQHHTEYAYSEMLGARAVVEKAACQFGQQLGLVSYISPNDDPQAWTQLLGYDKKKISLFIANVASGPGSGPSADPGWNTAMCNVTLGGRKILGYVRTGYLGRTDQAIATDSGSLTMDDWVKQIQKDVDTWYKHYGSCISGIFFDEGMHDCGPNNQYANAYTRINNYTKRKYPNAFTALNPGAAVPQCYEATMDTLMTFERDYDVYTKQYVPNNWTASDPQKIWHVVYNVPEDQIQRVADLAADRGAGLLAVTNGKLPNPYITLPADSYMKTLLNAVLGATNHLNPTPPSSLRIRADAKAKCVRKPSDSGAIGEVRPSIMMMLMVGMMMMVVFI